MELEPCLHCLASQITMLSVIIFASLFVASHAAGKSVVKDCGEYRLSARDLLEC